MHRRNPHPRSSKPAYIRLHETSPPSSFARFQFYARHFWSPTLTPFPISFFHFPLPHPLWRHNSATIVRIQSNFQLETRIFADGRRPKVYRSHSSRCFLLIETSYVTCARGCTRLIKPRVNSCSLLANFSTGFLNFWRLENRSLYYDTREIDDSNNRGGGGKGLCPWCREIS